MLDAGQIMDDLAPISRLVGDIFIGDAGCSSLHVDVIPLRIYALVATAEASTCKDPYRMTGKIKQNFVD
jgi:hypothetical protein